jgi:hypothetical protein
MFKTCPLCQFYSKDTSIDRCPTCGGPVQLTMLPPAGLTDVEVDPHTDRDECLIARPRTEALELPLAVRLGQIITGIAVFFAVSRWGQRALTFLIGVSPEVTTGGQAAYLFIYSCLLYLAASLAAGAVAGAYSVNWVPQGIGVGMGVLFLPLVLLVLFLPQSLPLYLIGVLITTALTVAGAYLGHRIIQPSQFLS